jgi:REP-associated tyrosine transposase
MSRIKTVPVVFQSIYPARPTLFEIKISLRLKSILVEKMPDAYIIMTNHFHAIIVIDESCRDAPHRGSTTYDRFGKPVSNSNPTIIRLFKASVTKQINNIRGTPRLRVWQRNYYEHIIRDEKDLQKIRAYIVNNPLEWDPDIENPINSS